MEKGNVANYRDSTIPYVSFIFTYRDSSFFHSYSFVLYYQLNGTNANKDEKFRATQYVQQVRSERGGKAKVEVLEEDQTSPEHEIFKSLKAGVSKNSIKRVRISFECYAH